MYKSVTDSKKLQGKMEPKRQDKMSTSHTIESSITAERKTEIRKIHEQVS